MIVPSIMKYLILAAFCIGSVFGDIAENCDKIKCQNTNCRCASMTPPISGIIPQLISLTFNDAVVERNFYDVWMRLLEHRTNADGSIASATFFVPHKYSNYSLVQKLYNMGHEIGVHSITNNYYQQYWRNSTLDVLVQEFEGQRVILNTFAKIPKKEIRGVRAPQLQFNGDVTFQAYRDAGLIYDNSWPTPPHQRLFPYTLDYKTTQRCDATLDCPKEAHPGFWVNPIIDLVGNNGRFCHQIHGCEKAGTPLELSNWLMEQVMSSYNTTRAPVTLLADASWFEANEHSLTGMMMFLDKLRHMNDVFLVSQYDIVQWMRSPIPVEKFKPSSKKRHLTCDQHICVYGNFATLDDERYHLPCCVKCPRNYPTLGNPTGY